jgi:hypothetical protein
MLSKGCSIIFTVQPLSRVTNLLIFYYNRMRYRNDSGIQFRVPFTEGLLNKNAVPGGNGAFIKRKSVTNEKPGVN